MKNKFENKYFMWGLTIFSVIVAGLILFFILLRWRDIVSNLISILKIFTPFLVGFIIAYLLSPILKFMEDKIFDKLGKRIFKKEQFAKNFSRFMSIVTSTLVLLVVLIGFCSYVIPEMFKSFELIISNIPNYLKSIENLLLGMFSEDSEVREMIMNNYDNISDYVLNYVNSDSMPNFSSLVNNISNGIFTIIKALYNGVLGYIIAIYLLIGKEKFIAQCKKLLYTVIKPDKAYIIIDNLRYTHRVFGDFLLGKTIDSLIIGIICFVLMLILNMPYPILLAVIVGVTNIIPYFGPIIGAVPCALLVLLVSPAKFLTFVIFIIILQQFDGNILGPKILGNKTGLQSFWVLFAIIVFGGLFGFVGMLFGVPLFAIIYAFFNGVCSRRLAVCKLPLTTDEYKNIDYIDPITNKPVYFTKKGKSSK